MNDFVLVAMNSYDDMHTHMTPRVFRDPIKALEWLARQLWEDDDCVRLALLLTKVGESDNEAEIIWRFDGDRTDVEEHNDRALHLRSDAIIALRKAGFDVTEIPTA